MIRDECTKLNHLQQVLLAHHLVGHFKKVTELGDRSSWKRVSNLEAPLFIGVDYEDFLGGITNIISQMKIMLCSPVVFSNFRETNTTLKQTSLENMIE